MVKRGVQAGRLLKARQSTLATAESCTGGLIAKLVTDVAGSSEWFERGLVTYSNRAKTELLGVSPALLDAHGAVSRECALAMARGLLVMTPASDAIAVTGIAGPGGGTKQKPVGLVFIAWARRGGRVEAKEFRFKGSRTAIRAKTAEAALAGLVRRLKRA